MLDILLILAAGAIGGLVTGYILSKAHWRQYNNLFRWHLKNIAEVKAAERKRYDKELEKIRKLQVKRFSLNRVGEDDFPVAEYLRQKYFANGEDTRPIKQAFKIDEKWLDGQIDIQWPKKNPHDPTEMCDKLIRDIEQQLSNVQILASLSGQGEIVYTPPFMGPDGSMRWGAAVIPKEEN